MSEKRTMQGSMDELARTSGELRATVLAKVADHFYGLLVFVLLVLGGLVLVGMAWPGALE